MAKRPTIGKFKTRALKNPEIRAEYDALSSAFQMKRQMIAMRHKAGLTQEQMAELLGTKKSNISRLESVSSENSPSLATIEKYAQALGYAVKVEFEAHSAK